MFGMNRAHGVGVGVVPRAEIFFVHSRWITLRQGLDQGLFDRTTGAGMADCRLGFR